MNRRTLSLTLTAAVYLIPIVVLLASQGTETIFDLFAADAFYYLTIASNSDLFQWFFSFDGETPTTGFHPLWQWLVTAFAAPFDQASGAELYAVFLLNVTLVLIGLLFLTVVLSTRFSALETVAILFVSPAYLAIAYWQPNWLYIASYTNGMETPLAICLFGLSTYLLQARILVRPECSIPTILGFSLSIGLLMLSRLELVILTVIYASIASLALLYRRRLIEAAIPFVVCFLLGVAYLANVYLVSDSLIPANLSTKASSALGWNLKHLSNLWNEPYLYATLPKHVQTVLPVVAALGLLAFVAVRFFSSRSARTSFVERDSLLVGLAIFVCLKAVIVYSSSNVWVQGHWYFPIATLVGNGIIVAGLVITLRRIGPSGLQNLLLIFAIALPATVFTASKINNNYNKHYYLGWKARHDVCREIESTFGLQCNQIRTIEIDDGLVSYLFDITAISGLGFALDPASLESKQRGTLLEHAASRGFRTVSSFHYKTRAGGRMLGTDSYDEEKYEIEELFNHGYGPKIAKIGEK